MHGHRDRGRIAAGEGEKTMRELEDLVYELRVMHGTVGRLCRDVTGYEDPVLAHVHASLGRVVDDLEALDRGVGGDGE